MGRNRKKKFAYRPSDRVVSRASAVSAFLGIVGIVGYGLLIAGSFYSEGNGCVIYGLAGWAILIMSIVGLRLSIKSFEDTASMVIWKIIGCTTNGLVLVFSAIIFILGI